MYLNLYSHSKLTQFILYGNLLLNDYIDIIKFYVEGLIPFYAVFL